MANAPAQTVVQVGPFVAGSTLSDLIGFVKAEGLSLHLVSEEEQQRDHYRQRLGYPGCGPAFSAFM